MAFVSNGGVRIYYEAGGTSKPDYILIHGGRCDHTFMGLLSSHLQQRGRSITLDLRGHGLSDKPDGPYRAPDFVSDVLSVAEAIGSTQPIVVGHSMGARVALAISQMEPQFASALVLLDNAVSQEPSHLAARRASIESPDWRELERARAQTMFLPTDNSLERRRLIDVMVNSTQAIAIAINEASEEMDTSAALRECRLPVMYIGSSNPSAPQEELIGLKPDLVYGQVVGSGHFLQVDAAPQISAMIDRFQEVYLHLPD